MLEHRKHARARLTFLVQYRFKDFETFARQWAQNISVGGMYVKTHEAYDEGTLVVVSFSLEDGGRLIEGLGRVVHASAEGMGLEFVSLDDASIQVIEDVVKRTV